MADDATRRETERDKQERDSGSDADERRESERAEESKERDGADKRRESRSSSKGRSSDQAAPAAGVEQPSDLQATDASSSRSASRSRRSRSTRLTEEQIDTPKRQTLILLGIISVLTVVLWVAAKAACNMRTQVTRPRKVTVEQIVRTPKHAAIELQQRWAKGDFTGAQELASAAVAAELEKEKNACDRSCASARQAAAEAILSTAFIIDRDGASNRVWVRTVGMPTGEQNYVLEVVRDRSSKQWEIVSRRAAEPGEKPTRPAPAPADSASDAGTGDASVSAADAGASPAPGVGSASVPAQPRTVGSSPAASAAASVSLPAASAAP